MADVRDTIFNKRAAERLRNPDDLDKYLRVANPNGFVLCAAIVFLAIGLLCWGFFGAVSTNLATEGASINGQVLCLLPAEEAATVEVGDAAYIEGVRMVVDDISQTPLSRKEAEEKLGSAYLASTLMKQEWAYVVTFKGDGSFIEAVPLSVSLTTDRVSPIMSLFGVS